MPISIRKSYPTDPAAEVENTVAVNNFEANMTAFEQPPAVPETSSVAPASSVGAPLEQVPLEQAPTEPVHIEPLILKKHPLPLRTFLPIVEKTDDILL